MLWLLRYPAEAENNVLQAVAELSLSDSRVVFSNFAPKVEDWLIFELKQFFFFLDRLHNFKNMNFVFLFVNLFCCVVFFLCVGFFCFCLFVCFCFCFLFVCLFVFFFWGGGGASLG